MRSTISTRPLFLQSVLMFAIFVALNFGSMAAYADPLADKIVAQLNASGQIVSPAVGADPCPCKVIGTATKDGSGIVFVASARNAWWMYTCLPLKEGGSMCLPQQLFGSTIKTAE